MLLSGSVFMERVSVILAPFPSVYASENSFVISRKKLGCEQQTIGHTRILSIGLDPACNGGSLMCQSIIKKRCRWNIPEGLVTSEQKSSTKIPNFCTTVLNII